MRLHTTGPLPRDPVRDSKSTVLLALFLCSAPSAHARQARIPAPTETEPRREQVFAGSVLDPLGLPIMPLGLVAIPSAPEKSTVLPALGSGGSISAPAAFLTNSDADGAFQFVGLKPGDYDLYWRTKPFPAEAKSTSGRGIPLGTTRVGKGLESAHFVVPQHRVLVRVVDSDGSVHDAAWGLVRKPGDEGSMLILHRRGSPNRWIQPEAIAVGREVLFLIDSPGEWLLTWIEDGRRLVTESVSIKESQFLHTATLTLGTPAPNALLSLRVDDPRGKAFGNPKILIESKASGLVLRTSPGWGEEEEILIGRKHREPSSIAWEVSLPPGAYRVRATAEPYPGCPKRFPSGRTPYRPAERDLELSPGENRAVAMTLLDAGHLDWIGTDPTDAESILYSRVKFEEYGDTERVMRALSGGRVILESRAGERIDDLHFEISLGGLHRHVNWLARPWKARGLSPLPPGNWTLRLEDGPHGLFEREMRVRAGEVTKVAW